MIFLKNDTLLTKVTQVQDFLGRQRRSRTGDWDILVYRENVGFVVFIFGGVCSPVSPFHQEVPGPTVWAGGGVIHQVLGVWMDGAGHGHTASETEATGRVGTGDGAGGPLADTGQAWGHKK